MVELDSPKPKALSRLADHFKVGQMPRPRSLRLVVFDSRALMEVLRAHGHRLDTLKLTKGSESLNLGLVATHCPLLRELQCHKMGCTSTGDLRLTELSTVRLVGSRMEGNVVRDLIGHGRRVAPLRRLGIKSPGPFRFGAEDLAALCRCKELDFLWIEVRKGGPLQLQQSDVLKIVQSCRRLTSLVLIGAVSEIKGLKKKCKEIPRAGDMEWTREFIIR